MLGGTWRRGRMCPWRRSGRTLGRVFAPHLPRRSVLLGLLAAPLTVAACSKDQPKPGGPTTTSATTATTAAPPVQVTGAGLPADLLGTMTALYLGGKVPAGGAVAAALAKRKSLTAPPKVAGSVGKWKGVPIAVVASGSDLTLLVKGKSWSVVGGWWPSLGVATSPVATMRVLAIGSDARPNQKVASQRSDSLHIIGVDSKGVGGIVGIPRDSWVPLASGGTNKINAALPFGGPKNVVKTVSRTSGVQLDGYLMTGFKGFRAMINAVGGLRYVAPAVFKGEHGILAKKGLNILRGEPALSFARERHTLKNGDFGRSQNQGRLMLAGMSMARAGGPKALVKYLGAMSPHVETDLSTEQVLNLGASVFRASPNTVKNVVVPGGVGTRSGQSVVLLGSGALSIFRDMRNGRLGA
ncbi:LytR family transcriptional regulator [Pedococcus bigeumensis]|uniref:LytR family transcriptional regulator n=1 Tax=Pedococcus bigeumensis TaxID=433644 RepID=A0A502CSR1_9MICO|nr:LytR family transcriptional regulator [Pedococcus bigeumensis]